MLLAIDIGNSNIVFGISSSEKWEKIWRIHSEVTKTADEYEVIFRSLFQNADFEINNKVNKVVISTVVPFLKMTFVKMIEKIFHITPIIISPNIYGKIDINVMNPYEIGTDIVANAYAAFKKFSGNNIVLDLGTALTLTTINSKGEIRGVSIAPGIKTALYSLASDTAQLPMVEIEIPPSILGKNTVHAIQSGVIIGYKGMIEYMVGAIKKELSTEVNVIATGGLSKKLAPILSCITKVEPNLTLDGLKYIADEID